MATLAVIPFEGVCRFEGKLLGKSNACHTLLQTIYVYLSLEGLVQRDIGLRCRDTGDG